MPLRCSIRNRPIVCSICSAAWAISPCRWHGAQENARKNKVQNATFYSADLAADQRAAAWAKADYELLLLDPPRSGADALFEYLPKRSARRVVYVSCHPASLARDAGILVERHGFKLVSAGVMDMFPHTAHVESIALFERA